MPNSVVGHGFSSEFTKHEADPGSAWQLRQRQTGRQAGRPTDRQTDRHIQQGWNPYPMTPSIQIVPTLGSRVYKWYLLWAIWSLGAMLHPRKASRALPDLLPKKPPSARLRYSGRCRNLSLHLAGACPAYQCFCISMFCMYINTCICIHTCNICRRLHIHKHM